MRSALTEIAGVVKADVAMPNSAVVTINKGEVFRKCIEQDTDAVQAVGRVPVDFKKLDCDFLTISSATVDGSGSPIKGLA